MKALYRQKLRDPPRQGSEFAVVPQEVQAAGCVCGFVAAAGPLAARARSLMSSSRMRVCQSYNDRNVAL